MTDGAYPPGECSPVTGQPLARALGEPDAVGLIRSQPADFVVDEILGFEPDGEGQHTLLQVRGSRVNSQWVARRIARAARVRARDVGFCGLKDRAAVTTQWFSVPGEFPDVPDVMSEDGIEFLRIVRHGRKLRRGSHRANAFCIVIRDVTGSREDTARRMDAVNVHGVPNYFGPQRFGRDAGNLELARRLARGGRMDRARRGFALSAARAAIFNETLSRRVAHAVWSVLLPGDAAVLEGSASWFPVASDDEELTARLDAGDIHPSGPLWGEGAPPVADRVLELEAAVGRALPEFAACLESARLKQERRALRLMPRDFEWEWAGDDLRLSFVLPRGAFATAVLAEIVRPVTAEADQAATFSST